MNKGRRTRRRGLAKMGTAKASATSACVLLAGERSRIAVMVEEVYTLKVCMLWRCRSSYLSCASAGQLLIVSRNLGACAFLNAILHHLAHPPETS